MLPQCSHNGSHLGGVHQPRLARSWGHHLTRKRGVYYYRRRLPGRLAGEVTLSLRTKLYREAEHRAERVDRVFVKAASDMASLQEIQQIVQSYIQELLATDLVYYHNRPGSEPIYNIEPKLQPTTAAKADELFLSDLLAEAKLNLVERKLEAEAEDTQRLMNENGLVEADRGALAHSLLRARVEVLEAFLKRVTGNFEPLAQAVAQPVPTKPKPVGPLFSEALPAFIELMVSSKEWRGQTLAQNEATYRMFTEVCGDRPVESYSRSDMSDFFETLRKLPALYSKDKRWRELSLREAVAKSSAEAVERLSMRTIQRHFSALAKYFDHLERHGKIEEGRKNLAHGFATKVESKSKDAWEEAELKKLFASPVWSGCASADRRSTKGSEIIRDSKYWLPILGVYHGNRLEEFAQLRAEDIQQEKSSGIWFFNISDEGERQLKNKQSKRRVPIHPEVIKLGFLGWLQAMKLQPSELVFSDLNPGGSDGKLGFYFTKWFGRYRKAVDVYRKGLDYHSFRHTITTKLFAEGVSREVIDELTGHEGEGTSQTVYMKSLPLKVLHEAISKVQWGDLGLKPKP